jgi:hypothetical protein
MPAEMDGIKLPPKTARLVSRLVSAGKNDKGLRLNPAWVAQLMGAPEGWLDD